MRGNADQNNSEYEHFLSSEVDWLKFQPMIVRTKFQMYGWLKAADEILTVFYVQFLRYLSSKFSLTTDDFNMMC